MRSLAVRLGMIAAMGMASGAAPAKAEMISSTKPDAVKSVLVARGMPAEMIAKSDEDPAIRSSYNGMIFMVLFRNCDTSHLNCKTLQYYLGFSDAKATTLDQINEWNRTKRFARAYRDRQGDPVIEMDMDLDYGGLPRENVNESLHTWAALMDAFRKHIYGSE